jgi:hypothetical protein
MWGRVHVDLGLKPAFLSRDNRIPDKGNSPFAKK